MGCTVVQSVRVSVSTAGAVRVAGIDRPSVILEKKSGTVQLTQAGMPIRLDGRAFRIQDASAQAIPDLRGDGVVVMTVLTDGLERAR